MQIPERINALRERMRERNLDAFVIATADPHQSEYPPDHWRHRAWISGFHGSAGTVVVTADRVGLWVDSRYYLEGAQAVAGTGTELFRLGLPDVPGYPAWLASALAPGSRVGCAGDLFSLAGFRALGEALAPGNVTLVADLDLVGGINPDRQPLPARPIVVHDAHFAGRSRGEKLSAIRSVMGSHGARWHLISTLDDIAWLLNVRGSDVPYNPVAVAHLLLGMEETLLFCEGRQLDAATRSELEADGVTILPYGEIGERLSRVKECVLLSPTQVSVALAGAIGEQVPRVEMLNLTTTAKAAKNPIEIEHLRGTMIRDGVAMVRFLHWLAGAIGREEVTEEGAARRLAEFRSEGANYVGEAFRTISAYRGHGALPHYSVSPETDAVLAPAGIYLLDSGAQYLDGTTDITRTLALDEPTDEMRRDFTLVLKGHIGLATLRFPHGTSGSAIDVVAREHLWREHREYGHGTGHGVGFYLNVHEGPQRIKQRDADQPLLPGMIVSNEPGLYRPDQYGIRIENLLVVKEDRTSQFGRFLSFETVTLCPIDRRLIDTALLTPAERRWMDDYHRLVRDRLLGHLSGEAAQWLEGACAPL